MDENIINYVLLNFVFVKFTNAKIKVTPREGNSGIYPKTGRLVKIVSVEHAKH